LLHSYYMLIFYSRIELAAYEHIRARNKSNETAERR
jgi:hypothetical protein